jgi:hypothetical protein
LSGFGLALDKVKPIRQMGNMGAHDLPQVKGPQRGGNRQTDRPKGSGQDQISAGHQAPFPFPFDL